MPNHQPAQQKLLIRSATPADAPSVARLLSQLGYDPDQATFIDRLTRLTARASSPSSSSSPNALFLACDKATVLGWLEIRAEESLETGRIAEIVGLVVDEAARGRGVGSALIERARAWAAEHNLTRLRVHTNVIRTDAAAFYTRTGFREIKQQRVFVMTLGSE